MKGFLVVLCLIFSVGAIAQGEGIAPLSSNPYIVSVDKGVNVKAGNTFDSTFIYLPDTLSLPFFDEFSTDRFQVYSADYTDPGVTSVKEFRLLDNSTSLPLPNDVYYTLQPTFRRVYDIATSNFTDTYFTTTPVKVGDLSSYPLDYETLQLYPPYYIYDTIGAPDISDTVWINEPEFFQDSATQFFALVNDPNLLWLDRNAYHNYRFGFEPRSLGVVTFDGLDENGFPYAIGTILTNYADALTSKPLDLAPLDAGDSVYFSFLYQKQGFGDIPESGDSLVLEFFAPELDQWFRVWSVNGGPVSPFQVGHIRISDSKFFKKGFQFRFRNYGALSGALDHFHLDYVHLRALSGYQDTLFKDFAFVYPFGSLLKEYTSVPWDHFKNAPTDKMNDEALIVVHNGSNLSENNQNGQIEVSYLGVTEGSFNLPAQTLSGGNINYGPNTSYYSYHDLSGAYVYDVSKPGNQVSFDILATASAQFPNLPLNDSTRAVQYFGNYYSYDDGTAEAAYGPTGVQARLAIQYESYEPDSLIGVMMSFVPSVNDVSDKLFVLTVWDDDNGNPGEVLYEDDAFFPRQPEYGEGHNTFVTYFFKDTLKVPVSDVFYVGWRQFDEDRLNVGLDRNLDNKNRTFYSINNGFSWPNSSFEGSVMIRPVFSTALDAELGIQEQVQEDRVSIYPNPTTGSVKVEVKGLESTNIVVYSAEGRMISNSHGDEVEFNDLPDGLYFILLPELGQKAYKVILRK